jgi:hypothetical protein
VTDVARLRALLAEASPRPWRPLLRSRGMTGVHASDHVVYHARFDPECLRETHEMQTATAALIAEAVNALPALLDEVEALRAEVARLQAGGCARDQGLTSYCPQAERYARERDEARAAATLLASVCLGCGQRDGRVDEDGLCTLCGGAVVVSHRGDVEAIEEYRAEMSARIDSLQNERDEARALVDAMSLTGPMDWTDGGGRG